MKKNNGFWICSAAALIIGFIGIMRLLQTSSADALNGVNIPAGFPTKTGLIVIWGFLFVLWGLGCRFVYSVNRSDRMKRNIFLNSVILEAGLFIWNYMIFGALNFPGALAVCIAILLLAVIVWFMYLLSHRYGGYLFTSMIVWILYLLYLSIAFAVKN